MGCPDLLRASGVSIENYLDEIAIGSSAKLPKRFELGTALCRTVETVDLNDSTVFDSIKDLLGFLSLIYTAVDRMDHLPSSEALVIQASSSVSSEMKLDTSHKEEA